MARSPSSTDNVILYILAIFVPPVSVFMVDGCGGQVFLSILLWILLWIPAIIHAWWRISANEKRQTQYVSYAPPPAAPARY